jgi:hypothetical protein
MISFWQLIVILALMVIAVVGSIIVGAYLMYKGKTAIPGERFFGGVPNGEVFSMEDAKTEEFPDELSVRATERQTVLENTKRFLDAFTSKEGGTSDVI